MLFENCFKKHGSFANNEICHIQPLINDKRESLHQLEQTIDHHNERGRQVIVVFYAAEGNWLFKNNYKEEKNIQTQSEEGKGKKVKHVHPGDNIYEKIDEAIDFMGNLCRIGANKASQVIVLPCIYRTGDPTCKNCFTVEQFSLVQKRFFSSLRYLIQQSNKIYDNLWFVELRKFHHWILTESISEFHEFAMMEDKESAYKLLFTLIDTISSYKYWFYPSRYVYTEQEKEIDKLGFVEIYECLTPDGVHFSRNVFWGYINILGSIILDQTKRKTSGVKIKWKRLKEESKKEKYDRKKAQRKERIKLRAQEKLYKYSDSD